MNTGQMDPVFASALRDALVAHVEATRRQRRRWRWRVGLGVLAGSTVVAGGAALAASLLSQPGAPLDTQLDSVVTATRTGTATINLGPRPCRRHQPLAHPYLPERGHVLLPRRLQRELLPCRPAPAAGLPPGERSRPPGPGPA